jgi:hypothetical protein
MGIELIYLVSFNFFLPIDLLITVILKREAWRRIFFEELFVRIFLDWGGWIGGTLFCKKVFVSQMAVILHLDVIYEQNNNNRPKYQEILSDTLCLSSFPYPFKLFKAPFNFNPTFLLWLFRMICFLLLYASILILMTS